MDYSTKKEELSNNEQPNERQYENNIKSLSSSPVRGQEKVQKEFHVTLINLFQKEPKDNSESKKIDVGSR